MIALDKKLSEICTFDMQSLSVFLFEVGFILQAKRVEKFYNMNKFLIQVKCRSGAFIINLENCSRVKLTFRISNFFFVNFRHQFEKQNCSMIMEIIAELQIIICWCTFYLLFLWTKIRLHKGENIFKNLNVKKNLSKTCL